MQPWFLLQWVRFVSFCIFPCLVFFCDLMGYELAIGGVWWSAAHLGSNAQGVSCPNSTLSLYYSCTIGTLYKSSGGREVELSLNLCVFWIFLVISKKLPILTCFSKLTRLISADTITLILTRWRFSLFTKIIECVGSIMDFWSWHVHQF